MAAPPSVLRASTLTEPRDRERNGCPLATDRGQFDQPIESDLSSRWQLTTPWTVQHYGNR